MGTLPNRSDCVIALNVQPEEVLPYCHMCQFYNISRLIVTVDYSGIEDDLEGGILDQGFVEKNGFYYTGIDPSTNAVIIGNNTHTKFTIFKVGQMVEGKEGEAAYRIVVMRSVFVCRNHHVATEMFHCSQVILTVSS